MGEVVPKCQVFGECGGCEYQDIPYEQELNIKESALKELFHMELGMGTAAFEPILPSPKEYAYRHRIDLSLRRTRKGFFIGFSAKEKNYVVDIQACPIAMDSVSKAIPAIKEEAIQKLPEKYRTATLTVKTGNAAQVCWGGIGRRSLRQDEKDYFWTEIDGKKIYYSLETFFQANLAILPKVVETLSRLPIWDKKRTFFDLYSGVGLFGICLADKAKKVVMIEDSKQSHQCAQYNLAQLKLESVQAHCGPVEDLFKEFVKEEEESVVLVDPPRMGLKPSAVEALNQLGSNTRALLYLSCHPESLLRDLKYLTQWKIKKVFPMDFFPKTVHVETLVWMERK